MSTTDMADLLASVAKIVGDRLGIDPASVDTDASLVDDLGFESLDRLTVVAQIENQFDIDIPEEVIVEVHTVKDIARALAAELRVGGEG